MKNINSLKEEYIELHLLIDKSNNEIKNDKIAIMENNQAHGKISMIFHQLEKTPEIAYIFFGEMLEHDNDYVRCGAATHCLALNFRIKQAEKTLIDIMSNGKTLHVRINAEGSLKVWAKQGYFKIY